MSSRLGTMPMPMPVNYSNPAVSTAPELASQLLVAKGKLVLATRILGEVRKIAQGMDFRHNGIHCLCPICTDMRHAVQAILVASEGTLGKLQEPGIMGMVGETGNDTIFGVSRTIHPRVKVNHFW